MNPHAVLSFIEAHAAWAGPALGLLSLVEGLFVVGVFVPLTVLLIAAGAAIGLGRWPASVLVWSVAGVSLGNALSYELGRRLPPGPREALAARAPRIFAAAERLFAAHGASALVWARFVGPPASAPFFAGYLGLGRKRFFGALAVCALWAPTCAAVGWLPAVGFATAAESRWLLAGVLFVLLLGGLLGARALARRRARTSADRRDAEELAKPGGGEAPAAS